VIAKELAHVFEISPFRTRDVLGEYFGAFEHHRQYRCAPSSRCLDFFHHRLEHGGLIALSDLGRLKVSQAALRVSANDSLDQSVGGFWIDCLRWRVFGRPLWFLFFCICIVLSMYCIVCRRPLLYRTGHRGGHRIGHCSTPLVCCLRRI
jgi:hypothetical protein